MAFTTDTQSATSRTLNKVSASKSYVVESSLVTGAAPKVSRKILNNSVSKSFTSNVSPIAENHKKLGWLCNVSEGVKLSKNVANGLNIDCRGKLSQYELMVKLLKAETCDVIYFDCHLSHSQIGILKMLQVFSSTELVHARLAMQFDKAMG